MVESVDTKDLKSFGQKWLCGFKSHSRYQTDKEEGVTALFFVVKREAVRGCRAGNVQMDNRHREDR